jgi:hypothetical protein
VFDVDSQQTTEATRDTVDGDDWVNFGNSWPNLTLVKAGGFCR